MDKIYNFSDSIDVEFVNSLINIRADKYVAAYPSALENFGLKDPWGIFQFRFSNLEILSGLSLGKYPYLSEGLNTTFNYSTWQAGMGLRNYFNENTRRVDLIPTL